MLRGTLFGVLMCAAWLQAAPAFAQTDTKKATPEKTGGAELKGDAAKKEEPKPSESKDEKSAGGGKDAKTESTSKSETTKKTETSLGGSASSKVATSGSSMDGATYAVRLRDLEQRVEELKGQIRRSHTRLSLLSETILSGGVGGARAEITFSNDLSNVFRLTRALFVLDGAVQYNKQDDTGTLAAQKRIPVYAGSVPPGDHTLQVLLQLRGHGYGVFSYLRGYRFEVKSSHSFTVTEGKTVELEAVAWEKGGVTTPVEQRPAIRYVEKIRSGAGAAPSRSGGSTNKSKSGVSGSFSVGTGGK